MKSKILTMVIIPLFLLGVVTIVVSNLRISNVVTSSIKNGLRGAAVSTRDTITYLDDGDLHVDENGNLYKGETNITENNQIADHIKDATQMDITVFYGDIRYMTSICKEDGSRVLGTKAGEAVIKAVLEKGEDYFSTDVDILGQKYYGYYVPLYEGDEIVGMIFAGMPQKNAKAQIMQIISTIIGIIAVMSIICVVLLILEITKLVRALHKGSEALDLVAEGQLNIELDETVVQRPDEIGQITRAIAKLKDSQTAIIQTMKEQSDSLNTSSEYLTEKTSEATTAVSQVEKAVEEVAQGATNQAKETQTATDNVIYMGDMVEETAKEVEAMYKNTQTMQTLGQEAFDTLHELKDINGQATESIQVIYEQTNMTNESAQKIKDATSLITAIASETNLLSLNASIEAARAGEQGRGFAVVATQIQQLAEQSDASAQQIEEIISYLISDSDKAVQTMDVVKDIMNKQNEHMVQMNERFRKVIMGIEESLKSMDRISEKTKNLDTARVNVVDTVQSLTAIAEENAASTEETFASMIEIGSIITNITSKADELKQIASEIDESMEMFSL
ncbi:MAG: cache domain-containing protein [Clostridium sp.]|nr:cache domain-containing protein [Clostridium sp.]MCM1399703.1 cache domain-containing protein [Clostridium sp.]MCM1460462.1 cache domain-containing protein [Bacteroides sp.]